MTHPPSDTSRGRRRPGILGLLVLLAVGFMLAGAAYSLLIVADYANALPREDEPPVVILPTTLVYGTAALFGPRGCVAAGPITTTVVGRNVAQVTFFHNGRRIKRVVADAVGRQRFSVVTYVAPDDFALHTVRARVRYVAGAIPSGTTLRHRFLHCRVASAVSG